MIQSHAEGQFKTNKVPTRLKAMLVLGSFCSQFRRDSTGDSFTFLTGERKILPQPKLKAVQERKTVFACALYNIEKKWIHITFHLQFDYTLMTHRTVLASTIYRYINTCTNYTSQRWVEGQLIGFQTISINTGSETHVQGSEESAVTDACEFSVAK